MKILVVQTIKNRPSEKNEKLEISKVQNPSRQSCLQFQGTLSLAASNIQLLKRRSNEALSTSHSGVKHGHKNRKKKKSTVNSLVPRCSKHSAQSASPRRIFRWVSVPREIPYRTESTSRSCRHSISLRALETRKG